jgi:hypothetical protein
MRWQALIPLLLGFAAQMRRDQVGLLHRGGKPFRRIDHLFGLAEIENQLLRIGNVTLAASLKAFSPEFLVGELPVVAFLF